MATIGANRVAEARLLLRQALRLLDDDGRVAHDVHARTSLRELAADLARDAADTLCLADATIEEIATDGRAQGWAG